MDISGQMMLDNVQSLAFGTTPRMPKSGTPDQIRESAKEFEAVFAAQMLEPIFEQLSTDGYFGGGQGENIFRSLMVQEFGKQIAERGGFGIGDAVAAEMLKIQEAQSGTAATPAPAATQSVEE